MDTDYLKKTLNIRTNFDYPPIPVRDYDWSAWFDDNYEPADVDGVGGGIIGTGRTEAEAIENLLYCAESW
jgi:hypothetical protein